MRNTGVELCSERAGAEKALLSYIVLCSLKCQERLQCGMSLTSRSQKKMLKTVFYLKRGSMGQAAENSSNSCLGDRKDDLL